MFGKKKSFSELIGINIFVWRRRKSLSLTFLNSSVSSTCPRTCFVRACRISRQWILSPLAIGRSKETKATVLGFGIPNGLSKLDMKSDSWLKFMNCVAWGSYLMKFKIIYKSKARISTVHQQFNILSKETTI